MENARSYGEQEAFWQGEFGSEYISRNEGAELINNKKALFQKILGTASDANSVIELGCNIGLNLQAMHELNEKLDLTGVEINPDAANVLRQKDFVNAIHSSVLDLELDANSFDLVLSKGFLIHVNPNDLPSVYEKMYNLSRKYICVCEYYNPTPTEIDYRGHSSKLFKRDFAGELMTKFSDLKLLDYGFCYHRDPKNPLADINWFLLSK